MKAAPVRRLPIVDALLRFVPSAALDGRAEWRPVSLASATRVRPRVRLSRVELTNGWLFGCLFDHMIRADQAWAGPMRLADRLGHLDVHRIAAMTPEALGEHLRGKPGRPALHRLWPRLARSIVGTSEVLLREYGADAENLWCDGLTIRALQRRLGALPGMGQKLVAMAVAALVDAFGRRYTGWRDADVAVDRHVARVFLRCGLVDGVPGRTVHSVGAVRDEVIRAARRLHPVYPAALDLGAFEVGRTYCRATWTDCTRCPLRAVCSRQRRHWMIA